jgi:hypothetical protein
VARSVDKNIFQGGLAHGNSLNFAGKCFHDIRHEAVSAFLFEPNLIAENRRGYLETGADVLG